MSNILTEVFNDQGQRIGALERELAEARAKIEVYERALQEIATHDPDCSADGPIRWAASALEEAVK